MHQGSDKNLADSVNFDGIFTCTLFEDCFQIDAFSNCLAFLLQNRRLNIVT